jgi:hypothetical protein
MALNFTGRKAQHPDGYFTYQATDAATNAHVIVRVSSEAERDKGEFACRQKADDKHSAGILEDGGIWVRTTDF